MSDADDKRAAFEESYRMLRLAYVERLKDALATLQAQIAVQGQTPDENTAVFKIAHSFAGTAMTFGFAEISAAAQNLQQHIRASGDAETATALMRDLAHRIEEAKAAGFSIAPADEGSILTDGQTVMIVASDQVLSAQLVDFYARCGLSSVPKINGTQALSAIFANAPALIVAQRDMKEPDCVTFLQLLQQSSAAKNIPVIVLSATPSREDNMRILKAGAAEYIDLPFFDEDLEGRSRRLINASRK